MIDKIKGIISENSEEKHFVEYGKGLFATDDAVDVIAEAVVKLFAIPIVSQQRELLLAFIEYHDNQDIIGGNENCIDNFLKANNCG